MSTKLQNIDGRLAAGTNRVAAVCRDNRPHDVHYVVFFYVLFIDAVHVRRRCANRFRVLVKPHAVGIAFVACLVYSQDDVTQVRVNRPIS